MPPYHHSDHPRDQTTKTVPPAHYFRYPNAAAVEFGSMGVRRLPAPIFPDTASLPRRLQPVAAWLEHVSRATAQLRWRVQCSWGLDPYTAAWWWEHEAIWAATCALEASVAPLRAWVCELRRELAGDVVRRRLARLNKKLERAALAPLRLERRRMRRA